MKPSKQTIRKLVKNKGEDTTECLKVLGSLESLYAIAHFWEHHAADVEIIGLNELIEFTQESTFDDKELAAFKAGLGKIPAFLNKCLLERQVIQAQQLKVSAPPPMVGVQ